MAQYVRELYQKWTSSNSKRKDSNDNVNSHAGGQSSRSSFGSNRATNELIEAGMKNGQFFSINTRSVRLGSYKILAKETTLFTATGIQIKVPDRFKKTPELMTINIKKSDVLQVRAHFNKSCPIIFLYLSPTACAAIREQLRMDKKYGIWLDLKETDETMKRVTILPDRVTEDAKGILKSIYEAELGELDNKQANEILVRSSPKEKVQQMIQQQVEDFFNKAAASSATPAKASSSAVTPATPAASILSMTTKLCQYPPGSVANSITVTLEDYHCLQDESFLNDQIIEFYFRWLQSELMSENDRNRTHFFGTYFYNKLTKKPQRNRNRLHQTEDNQNMTAAEKRYERVKRWTKKVNIFEKDFVVVPINEHSHWFLAVICFPNLIGCRKMSDDSVADVPELQRKLAQRRKERSARAKHHHGATPGGGSKRLLQIGSTSIIPIRDADGKFRLDESYDSDRDEAEASDSEMLLEDGDYFRVTREANSSKKPSPSSTPKKEKSPEPKESGGKDAIPDKQGAKPDGEKSANSPKGEAVKEDGDSNEKENKDPPEMDMEVDEEPPKPAGLDISPTGKDGEAPKTQEEDGAKIEVKEEEMEVDGDNPTTVTSEAAAEKNDSEVKKSDEIDIKPKEVNDKGDGGKEGEGKTDDGTGEVLPKSPKGDQKSKNKEEGKKEEGKKDESSSTSSDKKGGDAKQHTAVKQPCILIFDSLTTGSHARVAATLREYLTCEYKAKMNETRRFTDENMRGCCPRVPQQPNFSDCGLYLLQYAESFFESPLTDYALPVTNLNKWFTRVEMRTKREKIAGIIRDLNSKQYPNKKISFPKLVFTPDSGAGYSSSDDDEEEFMSSMMRKVEPSAASTVRKVAVVGETPSNKKAPVVKTISLSTKGPGAIAAVSAAAEKEQEKAKAKMMTTSAKKPAVTTTVTTTSAAASTPTVITSSSTVIKPSILKVAKGPSPKTEEDSNAASVAAGKSAAHAAAAAAGGGLIIVKKKGQVYVDGKVPGNSASKTAKPSKDGGGAGGGGKSKEASPPPAPSVIANSASPPVSNGVASPKGAKEKPPSPDGSDKKPSSAVMSRLDAAFGAAYRRPSEEEKAPSSPKDKSGDSDEPDRKRAKVDGEAAQKEARSTPSPKGGKPSDDGDGKPALEQTSS